MRTTNLFFKQVSRHATCLCMTVAALSGCTIAPLQPPAQNTAFNVNADAALTPTTRITRELTRLPRPKFKVPVAVYAFRDQTGQFKPQPDSNLSNAVTQGAASIVVKALLDSGWYLPIEREGFQNLLTERRVAKALESPADKGKPGSSYPPLMAANYLIEGGVVGYESNVRTGGNGANLLGVGGDVKYRVDQVTVNLRSVDVRTGQVINSVSVTKTIFSHSLIANVYKFVAYKTLLQAEGGYTSNEPSQLAVKEAIEAAVIHLTVQGIRDGAWSLKDDKDWELPLVQSYLREADASIADEMATVNEPSAATAIDAVPASVPMRASKLMLPPIPPLSIVPLRAVASNAPTPMPATSPTPATATQADQSLSSPAQAQVPAQAPEPVSTRLPVQALSPLPRKPIAPPLAPVAPAVTTQANFPAPSVAPAQQALQEATPQAMPSRSLTSDANLPPDNMPSVPEPREATKEVPMPQAQISPRAVPANEPGHLRDQLSTAPPLMAPLSSSMAEPMVDDATLMLAYTGR